MDIEKLKELSEYTRNLCFIALSKLTDKNARENVVAYGEGVRKLIDEAIASQPVAKSATSEDAFPSAIKWTGKNLREVIDLTGWNESASSKWTWAEYEQVVEEKGLKIFTPSGSVMADIGDWIIYDGKDCYVTAQKNKSATSEEVAEAIEILNNPMEWEWGGICLKRPV